MTKKDAASPLPDHILLSHFQTKPSKGDLRKLEITNTAIECLAETGIENTHFDAIAARLGVRRSHIAYYFPRFSDLLQAVVRYATATAQAITIEKVGRASGWKEQVSAYVEAPFEWYRRFPAHAKTFVLFYHLCVHQEPFRQVHGEIREIGFRRILKIVEAGYAQEGGESQQDLSSLARAIQALITSGLLEVLTCAHAPPADEMEKRTLTAVFASIDAVFLASRHSR